MSRRPSPALRKRRKAKNSGLRIEVLVRSARWGRRPDAARIVRRFVTAAAAAASTPQAELAIVLTDDSAIRALNRQWRGRDAPTNVLSFPAARSRHKTPHLGDIVIAYQTVAREARAEGKPFGHHLGHLAVHGFLHLLGYDHDNDRAAQRMERLETEILRGLRVPAPYADRPEA